MIKRVFVIAMAASTMAGPLSAQSPGVSPGGFEHGMWGWHHSCRVHVSPDGEKLTARQGEQEFVLTLVQIERGLAEAPDVEGFLLVQEYAGQWLTKRGFPTLFELQESPFACANLS